MNPREEWLYRQMCADFDNAPEDPATGGKIQAAANALQSHRALLLDAVSKLDDLAALAETDPSSDQIPRASAEAGMARRVLAFLAVFYKSRPGYEEEWSLW